MLRSKRIRGLRSVCGLNGPAGVILLLALTAGGCSADLGRFDFPSAGYAPDGGGSTSALPTPSEPMRRGAGLAPDDRYGYDRPAQGGRQEAPRSDAVYGSVTDGDPNARAPEPAYGNNRYAPAQGQRMASLPPAQRDYATQPLGVSEAPQRQQQTYTPASRAAAPAARPVPVSTALPQGQTIEVQQGDTLSSIARQYRVSISELMSINKLQSPILRPGQKIALPAGKRPIAQRLPATPEPQQANEQQPVAATPRQPQQAQPLPVTAQAGAPSDWQGTHTIAQGESLYGIARKHNVKVAELQRVNGISEVTKIRPGTVIKVPGNGSSIARSPTTPSQRSAEADISQATPMGAPSPVTLKPRIINGGEASATAEPKRVASLGSPTPTTNDADASPRSDQASAAVESPKASASTKFRWPVKGKVIANFGPRPDKSHNDGINIAVPQGAEVLASEGGTVAYAGNELKGYGNLVLIRHENNWVSAYAHNDQLLVKRGDTVRRGQTIAKAGNTGSVDQPQVHFELRRDSKPVDPLPHMEKP
jgi:murein DD-endopeptidase MepM/ murein hydrolase activator NlpD